MIGSPRGGENYDYYISHFSDIVKIKFLPEPMLIKSNRWLSCFTLDPTGPITNKDIIQALEQENIESRPVWKPLHIQPVFAGVPNFCKWRIGINFFQWTLPSFRHQPFGSAKRKSGKQYQEMLSSK